MAPVHPSSQGERALRRGAGPQRGGRVRLSHDGLKHALQETFPGLIWQRCQSHFRHNVLDQTPSDYLREEIQEKAAGALEVLEDGLLDATAVLALPSKYRRWLRTTNMLERFIQEIRWREKVIRIFPSIGSSGPSARRRMKGGPPVAGT